MYKNLFLLFPLVISTFTFAQDESASADADVEEVITVGSQIRGAKITGALPVSVISASDIDGLGVADGDELINNLVEQGMNFFNEQEQISGGVNAARGDTGAYNLRGMGVGNTLTLLNGRRMVNNAGYQTELIGGDYVPTMSVNSNLIPTNGLERLEVLKDGASAIYGADAVAGVINNVIQKDYEGFRVQSKLTGYDHFGAEDSDLSIKYGTFINDGKTNISVFLKHRNRESIAIKEDARWYVGDHRTLLPEGSIWAGETDLRNLGTYGMAQLDSTSKFGFTDSRGETQLFPTGSAQCSNSGAIDTGMGSCLVPDTTYYYRYGDAGRMYRGDMKRTNSFIFINHDMGNGSEFFAEIGKYKSDSQKKDMQGSFAGGIVGIPSDYYWFSQLPTAAQGISNGKTVRIDGWRPVTMGRTTNVEKEDYRYLLGFRGTTKTNWDWETALLLSKAESADVTSGRISYPALKVALEDTTSAAFNIFDPNPLTNNSERITVDVYRNDSSSLSSMDFKISNPEVMELPAGSVGMLVGFEWRKETYSDDRDPLLDGTTRLAGASAVNDFPFRSAVQGSSATGDTSGQNEVISLFTEFQVPITEKINAQLAIRHEAIDNADSATVGKVAVGYDFSDQLKFRASASESFRAPNLLQVNQEQVARTGSRKDWVYEYVREQSGRPSSTSSSAYLNDTTYTMLRYSLGADALKPEESTSTSMGFVFEPNRIEGLTITVDTWAIEKENTIALFGRSNNTAADLLARINAGVSGCTSGVPGVVRESASELDDDETAAFIAAGICPVGRALYVQDEYLNVATRELEGTDIAVYFDRDTRFGDLSVTYVASITDKFYQTPTGQFNELQSAVDAGTLPAYVNLEGFGDLLGTEIGGLERKDRLKVSLRKGDYLVSTSTLRISDFKDCGFNLSDGTCYPIPSMTTTDLSIAKYMKVAGANARIKLTVKNVADERAPLADGYNGFFSDVHSDLGKYYHVDFRVDF